MFYGDDGVNQYLEKVLHPPYKDHFVFWLLNILEQNRKSDSFPKVLARLPEVLYHFFLKQWHEVANENQLENIVEVIQEKFDFIRNG